MTDEEIRKVLEESFLDYNEETEKWVWVYKNGDERVEVAVDEEKESPETEQLKKKRQEDEEMKEIYDEIDERLDDIFELAMMGAKYGGRNEESIANLIKSHIIIIEILLERLKK